MRGKMMFIFCLSFLMPVHGAWGGTSQADFYQITVLQVDVSQDGGTTWIPVKEQSQAFDIASVNAGQAVAGYVSGVELDPGVYNACRTIVSNTITVRGDALNTGDGLTYCTRTNGNSTNSGGSANCPGTDEQNQAVTVAGAPPGGWPAGVTLEAGNSRIIVESAFNLNVLEGESYEFRVNFDVSSGVGVINGTNIMYPGAPTVSITQVS